MKTLQGPTDIDGGQSDYKDCHVCIIFIFVFHIFAPFLIDKFSLFSRYSFCFLTFLNIFVFWRYGVRFGSRNMKVCKVLETLSYFETPLSLLSCC